MKELLPVSNALSNFSRFSDDLESFRGIPAGTRSDRPFVEDRNECGFVSHTPTHLLSLDKDLLRLGVTMRIGQTHGFLTQTPNLTRDLTLLLVHSCSRAPH